MGESSWRWLMARDPRCGLKHMQWWPPATLRLCRCGDRWVIDCRRGPQAGYGILKPRLLRAGNCGSQLGRRPDRRNPRVIMALCPGVPAGCGLACLRLSRASRARARWAAAVCQRSCLVLCGAPLQQAAPPPGRGRPLPSQRWCLASRDRATWIPANGPDPDTSRKKQEAIFLFWHLSWV
jgi:hypothetical protein